MTPTLRKRKAKETAPEPAPEPAKRSRKAPKKVPKEKKVPTEKHDIGPSYPPKVEYRRWPKQDPPITEIEKVPKSWKWNADDNDLDDDDIDGHIARCEERIDTGIMPALWEHQLQVYKDRREAREEILALAPSRPYVAQRLHSLYRILKDLTENGDDVEQIPNAKAIIAAYESGELEWFDDNRVTYWHKGKQICEPKEWDTDDFVKAARKANGKGFWVEGCYGPGPQIMAPAIHIPPFVHCGWSHHHIFFDVRIPGATRYRRLKFLEDTGSSMTTMFYSDLQMLRGLSPHMAPNLPTGPVDMETVGGRIQTQGYMIDYRICGISGPLTKWYRLQTCVHPDSHIRRCPHRLSGRWWRNVIFSAQTPDNTHNIYLATTKQLLTNITPDVSLTNASPALPLAAPPGYGRFPLMVPGPGGPPVFAGPPGPAAPPGRVLGP